MKFLILVLCSISLCAYSQNKKSIPFYKWEGYSKQGHCIFGIANSKEDAQLVIDDFNVRNAKTKYKMVFQMFKKSVTDDPDFVTKFYTIYPKKYQVLRIKDLAASHIYTSLGAKKAIEYLQKSNDLDPLENTTYLNNLIRDLKIYRFKVIN